ncbi:MAG: copper ion binding protein, partial [Candidatus Latescibacteria bacterium]|nr:copper ion binding protein [Candidatus Latescibacterota bacterium]
METSSLELTMIEEVGVRADLPVSGMHCASCANAVEKVVSGVDGVISASINHANEQATVIYDPGSVTVAALLEAVKQAGYGVPTEQITLSVGGMTCASCVAHVEKALKGVDGVVETSVNLATEQALVTYVAGKTDRQRLSRAVADAGYTAVEEDDEVDTDAVAPNHSRRLGAQRHQEYERLRSKVMVSAALSLMIMAIGMGWIAGVDTLPFEVRSILMLLLILPLVSWVGAHFYTGAWKAAKRGSADMNTLVAVGTGAALLFSVIVTVAPWLISQVGQTPQVYYDT